MVLGKAIIQYTVWNAIGAISNLYVKQKVESLIDSNITFFTSNKLTILQWQDTFIATMLNWTQR